jgi:GT2 family glycosyltransferase
MVYPANGVHAWTFSCFLKTIIEDMYQPENKRVIDGHVIAKESGPNLDVNRNYIVAKFLDTMPDVDWLLFLDSDEKWEPQDLYDFIRRADPEKTPVVSGLYKRIDYAVNPPVTQYAYWHLSGEAMDPKETEQDDYYQIGAVPAGALLMHRTALEKVRNLLGDVWFTADQGGGMREDMAFCDRLAHLKIPVHVDPRFRVSHIKYVAIPG